jgi:hypothetical protein
MKKKVYVAWSGKFIEEKKNKSAVLGFKWFRRRDGGPTARFCAAAMNLSIH